MTQQSEDRLINFLRDLMHPEGYGFAVTQEVRSKAKELLIMIESDKHEQDSAVRSPVCTL